MILDNSQILSVVFDEQDIHREDKKENDFFLAIVVYRISSYSDANFNSCLFSKRLRLGKLSKMRV